MMSKKSLGILNFAALMVIILAIANSAAANYEGEYAYLALSLRNQLRTNDDANGLRTLHQILDNGQYAANADQRIVAIKESVASAITEIETGAGKESGSGTTKMAGIGAVIGLALVGAGAYGFGKRRMLASPIHNVDTAKEAEEKKDSHLIRMADLIKQKQALVVKFGQESAPLISKAENANPAEKMDGSGKIALAIKAINVEILKALDSIESQETPLKKALERVKENVLKEQMEIKHPKEIIENFSQLKPHLERILRDGQMSAGEIVPYLQRALSFQENAYKQLKSLLAHEMRNEDGKNRFDRFADDAKSRITGNMVIIDDAYIENYLKKFNRELNEDLQNEIRWYEAANHIAQELIPHFHNLEMIVKDIRQYLDVVVKAEKDLLPPMQRIREELERESFTSREASAVFGGFYHKLEGRNLKDKATAAETPGMYNVINKKIQAAKKTIIHDYEGQRHSFHIIGFYGQQLILRQLDRKAAHEMYEDFRANAMYLEKELDARLRLLKDHAQAEIRRHPDAVSLAKREYVFREGLMTEKEFDRLAKLGEVDNILKEYGKRLNRDKFKLAFTQKGKAGGYEGLRGYAGKYFVRLHEEIKRSLADQNKAQRLIGFYNDKMAELEDYVTHDLKFEDEVLENIRQRIPKAVDYNQLISAMAADYQPQAKLPGAVNANAPVIIQKKPEKLPEIPKKAA